MLSGGFCGCGGVDGFKVLVAVTKGTDDAGVCEVLTKYLLEADLKDATIDLALIEDFWQPGISNVE